ncbi:MAG TPA: tripartite tricarboxylate transporter substrate binding protein [Stenotrophomonas sp.]|nr:tripartite tricarboxylate transporter substrate binding protein [Stenotrophomonas sp.]
MIRLQRSVLRLWPRRLLPSLLTLPLAALLAACGGPPATGSESATAAAPAASAGYQPRRPECIAPASPGGSFDLTCKLAQSALVQGNLLSRPMRVTYMPGGVGAVAYNTMVAQRPADGDVITAFSSGSLLNLAQGKFGQYDETAVRWLAAVGTSYGAITVRSDSPYRTLADLVAALRRAPDQVVIGAGGTVGGQDWMQTAMLAKAAGVTPARLRYVAMEGGGEIATALLGGHIQVGSTDISDSMPHVASGALRVLAVLSEERLPGPGMAELPTAREQGYDVVWKVMRGYYMGPQVDDAQYAYWKGAFDTLLQSPEFARLRSERELFPLALTGPALDAEVRAEVARYRELAREFGLVTR